MSSITTALATLRSELTVEERSPDRYSSKMLMAFAYTFEQDSYEYQKTAMRTYSSRHKRLCATAPPFRYELSRIAPLGVLT